MNTGLRGNRRIVFDELQRLIAENAKISYAVIADRANCDPSTVRRALYDLQEWGLVSTRYRRRGCRLEYSVCSQN